MKDLKILSNKVFKLLLVDHYYLVNINILKNMFVTVLYSLTYIKVVKPNKYKDLGLY